MDTNSFSFTGSAQGPTALLRAVAAHLVEAGFSLYVDAADGAGRRAHLSDGTGLVVNMRSAIAEQFPEVTGGNVFTGLLVNVGTGLDVTKSWHKQVGTPTASNGIEHRVRTIALGAAAQLGYWLFVEFPADVTQPSVTLVVETAAGQVAILGFGHIDKNAGPFQGGLFFFAENAVTNNNSHLSPFFGSGTVFVRADVDSFTGKWMATSNGSSDSSAGFTGKHAAIASQGGLGRFPSAFDVLQDVTGAVDGVPTMMPARIFVQRDDGGWSWLGDLPGIMLSRRLPYPTSAARGSSLRMAHDSYVLFPGFALRTNSPTRAAGAAGVAARLADTQLQEYRGKVLPSVQAINGGYIDAPRATNFRLWNVNPGAEMAIRAVNQPDIYGLVTTPDAPFTLLPGASRQVNVTIQAQGRPAVRDHVQFYIEALGPLSPFVTASYHRAQPFPLVPNGTDSVKETLRMPSTVIEARSGKEQRSSLVAAPRRSVNALFSTADQDETSFAEALLLGSGRLFAAPLWPAARHLAVAVPAGAGVLQLATDYSEFSSQGYAVAVVSPTEAYVLELAEVRPGVLTLAAPAPAALPAGTVIGPAIFCRIESEKTAALDLADSVDYTLTFNEEV